MIQSDIYNRLIRLSRNRGVNDDARDLVHSAFEAYLAGNRKWDPSKTNFIGFMIGTVRSLRSVKAKSHARLAALSSVPAQQSKNSEDYYLNAETLSYLSGLIDSCVADDQDLKSLWLAVKDGCVTRSELASSLCWTADRVSAARIKLQRRLLKSFPETFSEYKCRR